jgi:cytochrome c peroxidase
MMYKHLFYILGLVVLAADCFVASDVYAASNASLDDKVTLETFKNQYNRPEQTPFPADNSYSEAKAKLGKILFFDPRLSRSKVMSCTTCHNPGMSWSDGNPKGIGDFHKELPRKDPTLYNLAWDELFFWDGRAESLEEQVLAPIQADGEMHLPLPEAVHRLNFIEEYMPLFSAAFPNEKTPITQENISKALAIFVRTIISTEAPFDRWIKGDAAALSPSAQRGFVLFNGKANCSACHSGWRLSDGSFRDIGLNDNDIGRGKWLPLPDMQHAFKTVGLRNIARRSPYMHNGSVPTLMDVIDHYDHGFVKRESLSDKIKPLHLSDGEKKDLVEFLKSLTSPDEPVTVPDLPQ